MIEKESESAKVIASRVVATRRNFENLLRMWRRVVLPRRDVFDKWLSIKQDDVLFDIHFFPPRL